jgi:hypothetical protein
MTQTLDRIQQQLDDSLASDAQRGKMIIGAATGFGASVFAGYVIWAFRGTSLLLGALSAMPAWRCFDPLPVLVRDEKKRQADPDKDDAKVKELLGANPAIAGKQRFQGEKS